MEGPARVKKQEKITTESTLSPELGEAINQIDFSALKQVYEDKMRKLGLNANSVSFVDRENFRNIPTIQSAIGRGGVYKDEKNEIWLSSMWPKVIEKVAENQTFNNAILSLVCHEETHATSDQKCAGWENAEMPFVEKQEKQIGFQQYERYRLFGGLPLPQEAEYTIFNEGVTDMIGEEVYDTYISNTDRSTERKGVTREYFKAYPTGRKLVNSVIDKISSECGLDEELVWSVIQRGYFAGEDIGSDTMKRLFNKVAPESLFQDIREAGGEFSPRIPAAIKQIKSRQWSEEDKKRIRRWFKYVGNVMQI